MDVNPLLHHLSQIFFSGRYISPCPANIDRPAPPIAPGAFVVGTNPAATSACTSTSGYVRRDIIELFINRSAGSAPPIHVFEKPVYVLNSASKGGSFLPLIPEDHAFAQRYAVPCDPEEHPQPMIYIPPPVLHRLRSKPLGSGQLKVPITQHLDPSGDGEDVHIFVRCPNNESMAEYKGVYRLGVLQGSQLTRDAWARLPPLGRMYVGPGERGMTPFLNFVRHMVEVVKLRDMDGFVYLPTLRKVAMKYVGFDGDLLARMDELAIEAELIPDGVS